MIIVNGIILMTALAHYQEKNPYNLVQLLLFFRCSIKSLDNGQIECNSSTTARPDEALDEVRAFFLIVM